MQVEFIQREPLILAGFSFFGDPFKTHAGWVEENEIGRLWQRLMSFMRDAKYVFPEKYTAYEVHLQNHESRKTGEFEVFVGTPIENLDDLPPELCLKVLPAGYYAHFTVDGSILEEDEMRQIEMIAEAGWQEAYPFFVQRFDERFKGVHRMAESVWEIEYPVKKK